MLHRPRGLRSNRGLLAVLHITSTGYDLVEGELISVTLMPLNEHIKISDQHSIFSTKFCPMFSGKYVIDETKNAEYVNYLNIKKQGVQDLKKWFESLQLDCRITLLGYDLYQQIEFLVDWFGGKQEYLEIFSPITRDILTLELFRRDCEAYRGEGDTKLPTLYKLVQRLGINPELRESPQRMCLLLAEIYRTLLYES